MIDALLAGSLAGYAIAIPVGPIAILIIDAGLRHGWPTAAAAGAGAASADGLYAAAGGLFGSAISGLLTPWIEPLRLLSAGALVAIAVRIALSAPDPPRTDAATRPVARTYLLFLGLTLVNPMTFIYFSALVLSLPGLEPGIAPRVAFAAGALAASLSWQLLLAAVGSVAHGRLPEGFQRATRLASAAIVSVFAAAVAIDVVVR